MNEAVRASVVVPAHDEAAVILRCLDLLLGGPLPLDVVVVANACSDDTAERARSRGVRVLETTTPGKANALNLGDASCRAFPRVYLDADVELSQQALAEVLRALDDPQVLAAAPELHVDTRAASPVVRAYYKVWTALPYVQRGMIGSGVYTLSERGRGRFDAFPDIIGDDAFVRLQYTEEERRTVRGARFTVHPPRTVRTLVDIKTRVSVGNVQARALTAPMGPTVKARPTIRGKSGPSSLQVLRSRPDLWPALPAYGAVYAVSRLRARRRLARGSELAWDRDNTSRRATAT